MPGNHPPYPAEFRRQLVELARAGRSAHELAREFEPCYETIRLWIKQADRDEGRSAEGLRTDERQELCQLRRENRQLHLEREILAKATAWFARETDATLPSIMTRLMITSGDWLYQVLHCPPKRGNSKE